MNYLFVAGNLNYSISELLKMYMISFHELYFSPIIYLFLKLLFLLSSFGLFFFRSKAWDCYCYLEK
jgi:hypothetical protein